MAEANPYEEQRRRQVEENKSKLEELRLHRLSAAVRVAAVKPMPVRIRSTPFLLPFLAANYPVLFAAQKVTIKPRNHRSPPDVIRRSARIARLDKQPYFRITKAHRDKKAELPRPVYATNEERAYAIAKAQELKDQLDSHYPAFLRPLSLSYAAGSWLVQQENFYCLVFTICYRPICISQGLDLDGYIAVHTAAVQQEVSPAVRRDDLTGGRGRCRVSGALPCAH
jgi:hypothetical protein